MNVRAFTADDSSGLDPAVRGSYLGFIDKVSFNFFFIVWFVTKVFILSYVSTIVC
jgi:hypothetical protein